MLANWPAAAAPPADAGPGGLPPGFRENFVFRNLNRPTQMGFLPDGRVLVAEQSGVVKLFPSVERDEPQVVLDQRDAVFMRTYQGMLGLAVDPDFEHEPYFYVLYSFAGPPGASEPVHNRPGAESDSCPDDVLDCAAGARLSRFQLVGQMAGPEQVLVEGWCNSADAHSIAGLAFAPDGALIAGGGDGAVPATDFGQHSRPFNVCGDPPEAAGIEPTAPNAEGGSLRSQDLRTRTDPTDLAGTIIRVDRATGAALPDNPLAGDAEESASRIAAYGLRNPFRFTFRPGTEELWIADVGWKRYEEINVLGDLTFGPPRNLGWPCYEGPSREPEWEAEGLAICQTLYDAEPPELLFPAFSFARPPEDGRPCAGGGAALTAIAFYDGDQFPDEYHGALFLADQQLRCIWVMSADSDGLPDPASVRQFRVDVAPIDLHVGPDGALYYVDVDEAVHRISYVGR